MKRAHRKAHARIWSVLGLLLPLAFFAILAMRQSPPTDRPAVLIEAPAVSSGEASQ
ncbi:hypothetical protein FIV06_11720 [Labrenzia sp. THAF191b]|uniref:hypothetical protein n=1 Tax=unclassified Labrenzia TaxID=2648686 RepID=UPI0012A9AA94|nr:MULTISPECIES: hypothetical protein [unclassified Labrenzia]QFS98083.1 hypothetical protein FIV06_11720 [Labrenzia sp. THAF191b]QFT04397.1 hypothetical protein FIV05_11715 [Labrenzia sp. THAF191a]QFT15941.1 hypothetical protein FIV03_11730 [Labrenzia sp. THAF187b]